MNRRLFYPDIRVGDSAQILYRRTRSRLVIVEAQLAAEQAARREAEANAAAEHHAATHDTLTGLLNRAGLHELWPTVAHLEPTVAVVDLNDFKPVNDQYGHDAGDLVLKTIAGRMLRRSGCTAIRLGGDEFTLILTARNSVRCATRLAEAIAQPVDVGGGVMVSVSASIGVAAFDAAAGLSVLLGRADAAERRSKGTKHCGDGRVVVAVFDARRDDHTPPSPGARPSVRTRDLTAVNVKGFGERGMPAFAAAYAAVEPDREPELAR